MTSDHLLKRAGLSVYVCVCVDLCADLRTLLRYLYGFEEYCRSASISFRTASSSAPPRLMSADEREADKMEAMEEKLEEGSDMKAEREVKERQMSPRVRRLQGPSERAVGGDWF